MPESSVSAMEIEEQQLKQAEEQSAREALEGEMAARAQTKKTLRVPGSHRPIVIDGMNLGFAHGNDQKFSAQGLQIAYQFFIDRGWDHSLIKIFVKRNKHFHQASEADKEICETMNKAGIITWPMGNYDDM